MLDSLRDPRSSRLRLLVLAGLASAALCGAAHAESACLRRAASRLEQQGTPAQLAKLAARHVLLGLPSKASLANEKDYLLVKSGSVVSYNATRNAMNWASWVVDKSDLGAIERQRYILDPQTGERLPAFRPDELLPAHFYKPVSADYVLAEGWSRGHMLRSGERTASIEENRMTFVFSNMLPQAVNNNSGPWNHFENYYRDRVTEDGFVAHVIAGGIFGKTDAPARKVAVPSETWKIVALLKSGQTLEQVDEHTRVMAVRMPNDNEHIKLDDTWEQYRTSVADLEKATGLSFFSHLDPNIASALKRKIDDVKIGPPPPRPWPIPGAGQPQAIKVTAQGLTGVVKAYLPDKGYGFIRLDDGREIFFHRSARLTSVRDGEPVELDLGTGANGREQGTRVKSLAPKAILLPVAN